MTLGCCWEEETLLEDDDNNLDKRQGRFGPDVGDKRC